MDNTFLLWLLVIAAGVIVFLILVSVGSNKLVVFQNQERARWGEEKGLKILDQANPDAPFYLSPLKAVEDRHIQPFRDIPFISKGDCHNFLEGEVKGRMVRIFDHSYTERWNDDNRTITHSLVAVSLEWQGTSFEIRPRGLWDRIKGSASYPDNSANLTPFKKKFKVICHNNRSVDGLLDSSIQKMLLQESEDVWLCQNNFLVVYRSGRCGEDLLERMLKDALFFANRIDVI